MACGLGKKVKGAGMGIDLGTTRFSLNSAFKRQRQADSNRCAAEFNTRVSSSRATADKAFEAALT
jgi:hypothetical protein